MKLKAPVVTRESLIGLKTLIRYDFAREVRKVVEAAASDISPAATTLKILILTEKMNDAEQPLSIALAMIDMTGGTEAWLPLNEDRFALYSRYLNLETDEQDFKGLPPDLVEKANTVLKATQAALKKDFDEAGLIDPQEMMRGPTAPSLGAPPPGGMLN